ncbi:MAG: CoB--CoM heterodisulfide reductase iron-sulfur subunit B family protein [Thermodesulfobacteriota bacterium]
MRFALFLGCQVPGQAPQYEKSSRLVLKKLGVALTDLEFNCCGYPLRHQHFHSYLLAAARNLALAEAGGLDLLTLCKCCLGSLRRAQDFLAARPELLAQIQADLAREGLAYRGRAQVRHLQSVLHDEVGLEAISSALTRRLQGLRVATLYGCHALRPSRITGFDRNPYQPTLIEDLLEATGAASLPWDGKLKCCGAPLRERNEELSLAMIGQRFAECQAAGADVLNVDCPHTLAQIKWAFKKLWPRSARQLRGVVLYPQLLGLALGIAPEDLALDDNRPRAGYLANHRSPGQRRGRAASPAESGRQPAA